MLRLALLIILGLASLPQAALSQAFNCDQESAWRRVRLAYPILGQTLAMCASRQTGGHVIVLTEPPAHLLRGRADAIVRALFSVPVTSVQRRRHRLGFDGWVEDLVIVAKASTLEQVKALGDDLARLAVYAFGSAYKTDVEDIARLQVPRFWDAPPALEVSADELFAWLLGPKAEKLIPLEGGSEGTLQERSDRDEFGTYYTVDAGLVLTLLPAGIKNKLNDHVEDLRRFVVDTDTFLGAMKLKGAKVALIGRERTTPLAVMPPLRVDTILLLASALAPDLAQSYERHRPFAGKLLTGAGNLFGWDWAPILLSDLLSDTELGTLLNFTDDMLKGWSESGTIEYQGFTHPKPQRFPFEKTGAFNTIGSKTLTYNWNTAGVGLLSRMQDVEIFSVRNTGSLPVSYFPEGSESNAVAKAKLVRAEDNAYKYFSSLRNPMLARAVQYSALFQVFQSFDLQADSPQEPAEMAATFTTVESLLKAQVIAALQALADPSAPSNPELLLEIAHEKFGAKGQEFERKKLPKINAIVQKLRNEIATIIGSLDKDMTPSWREEYAGLLAEGHPISKEFKDRLEKVAINLSLVRAPDQVRKAVLAASERDPEGWTRTPSIVVSRGAVRNLVGGHNIGGRATRVEIDPRVPKGRVEVSGSYEEGRVIRVNPADAPAGRELVRVFDREVGLNDANIPQAVQALEAKLHEAPVVARPPRSMNVALENTKSAPRSARGAEPNASATPVGYRPGSIDAQFRKQIEALAEQSRADIVVARADGGNTIIFRTQPKQAIFTVAPNHPSMLSALEHHADLVAKGPPPALNAKIVFHNMSGQEVELAARTLANRNKAAAGAGGKPPFGGGKPPIAISDGPQPGWGFWKGRSRNGKGLPLVAEGKNADLLMVAKPEWSAAEVRFSSPDAVMFGDGPDFAGAGRHAVELTVPVRGASGGIKKMFLDLIAGFRDKLPPARAQEINGAVTNIFKESKSDLRDALTRYKKMMIEKFESEKVWIRLHEEAGDVIVTEKSNEGEAARRG